jgi:hypothetical protein
MRIFAVFLMLSQAAEAGVLVRFLANAAGDSVARYDLYRSETEGLPGARIGSLPALPGDTLAFADSQVVRGRSYSYSLKAVNAAGGESDASEAVRVAFPALGMPDTLFPGTGSAGTPYRLPASAHPLAGFSALSVELVDSTRFRLRYNEAAGTLEFFSRSGRSDTGRAVIRAAYFGKFEDRDSVVLIVAAETPSGVGVGEVPAAIRFPSRFSPASGPLVIRHLPGPGAGEAPGSLDIYSLGGRRVFHLRIKRAGDFAWDGRGQHGETLTPARYLLMVLDGRGRRLASGAFSLLP